MTLQDVVAVADGAQVAVSDEVVEFMRASRGVVDSAVAQGEAIYGVTTGVGHARDQVLPSEALESMQPVLLEMHVGAMGDRLSRARVRAGMVARLNGFARGGAGVSPGVALALVELLNRGIHPVIPGAGSVGSGDLGQLALLGRVLLGRGAVEVDGRTLDAGQALREAGLTPVALKPKDGLALMSSNALSIGHGGLLVRDVERLMGMADLVAAVSMDTFGANPSIVDPAVARAGAGSGQQVSARAIRFALGDAGVVTDGVSVQDALSFRVVPQVHGACRDTTAALATAVEEELNAPSDNPFVDVASGRVISNGNFHPMNMALAAESMRVALCHVGLLVERRTGHLWDTAVTSLGPGGAGPAPPAVGTGTPPHLAGLGLRYPAAALYTRLRHLANPITLDVPALDLAVEDHATNVSEALARTEQAIGIVRQLLVVEVLIAVVLARSAQTRGHVGRGTERLLARVMEVLDDAPDGTMPDDVHRRVSSMLWQDLDELIATDESRP